MSSGAACRACEAIVAVEVDHLTGHQQPQLDLNGRGMAWLQSFGAKRFVSPFVWAHSYLRGLKPKRFVSVWEATSPPSLA